MIYSKLLSKYADLYHGFTTREEPWSGKELVLAEQIHEDKIALVTKNDEGKIIKGVDGLVIKETKVKIGVRTADCVPILFYEPVKKIVGVVHAGWKGTLEKISEKMISRIRSLGGIPKNIIAVIGPHIGMCCYDIPGDRADFFTGEFGEDSRIISNFENGFYLDLGYVNFLQLLKVGVLPENTDATLTCTSCQKEKFFSYRRSVKENDEYGEMLSFIGIK